MHAHVASLLRHPPLLPACQQPTCTRASPPCLQLRYTWPEAAYQPDTLYRFYAFAINARGRSVASAVKPYQTVAARVVSF